MATTTAASRHEGDHVFVGAARFLGQVTVPDATITKAKIAAAAGIEATKLQHQHRVPYAQPNTTATAVTQNIYTCYGVSGTIVDFRAGSIGICAGAATITVDLKKNGTTVLSAVITLNNSSVARVAQAGTLSVTTLAAGDVLEVVVTATAGGGTIGTGFFCSLTVEEDAR